MQQEKKALPSGRWLWIGGTEWIEKEKNFSGAYNCTSTNLVDWQAVELINGGIGEDIASYLLHSEQTPSAVFVGERINQEGIVCSGGLLAQILPKAERDYSLIDLLEDRCKEINSFSELLNKKGNNLISLIEEIFPDLDQSPSDIISTSQEVHFKCRCSRERSL